MELLNTKEISNLVSSHQEGSYWDFKREWYSKKADLLHDIICMANNIECRNAYIIIGIDDNFNVCGVADDPNRKNTQKLIDFLRNKKFAGGCRPTVSVTTITIDGANQGNDSAENYEIDVITVYRSSNTPYYLTENYTDGGKIYANHIYTRVQDSNIAKDKSADIHDIEILWRNRFGLDKTILERLHIVLSDCENWVCNKSDMPHYHELFPEFHFEYPELKYYQETGEYEQNDISHQPYSGFYINQKASWYPYQLFYHSTLLHESSYYYFDETRIMLSDYEHGYIGLRKIPYYYYEKDSVEGKVLKLLVMHNNMYQECDSFHDNSDYCTKCSIFGSGAFLVFDNERDRHDFESYVDERIDVFDSITVSRNSVIDHAKKHDWDDKIPVSMLKLYNMFIKWEEDGHS